MTTLPLLHYQDSLHKMLLAPLSDSQTAQAEALLLVPNSAPPEYALQRLAIHRNNVLYSLSTALADTFPVLYRLVGENYFRAIARDYILASPPQDAVLTGYGMDFPAFLVNQPTAIAMPWLGDIGTLEFLYQQAFHAADAEALTPLALQAVPEDQLGDARLLLHPSAAFLQSPYPVDTIWAENLKDEPDVIDLASSKPVTLLIYRRGMEVQVVTLSPLVNTFLFALANGANIAEAWEASATMTGTSDEKFAPMFAWLLTQSIFTGVEFR